MSKDLLISLFITGIMGVIVPRLGFFFLAVVTVLTLLQVKGLI